MDTCSPNAQRLARLFDHMRSKTASPAFYKIAQLGLSPSHWRMMHLLSLHGSLSMKDIADQLELTPPSVTALTRRLIQHQLIQRKSHADDSRVSLLSLTETGTTLVQQIQAEQAQGLENLLANLNPEEQLQFLELFERAVQIS